MPIYRDIDNDSGVHSYEIAPDHIEVWFKGNPRSYTYSYSSAGSFHIENMKRLAAQGEGLNAYIQRYVKHKYQR